MYIIFKTYYIMFPIKSFLCDPKIDPQVTNFALFIAPSPSVNSYCHQNFRRFLFSILFVLHVFLFQMCVCVYLYVCKWWYSPTQIVNTMKTSEDKFSTCSVSFLHRWVNSKSNHKGFISHFYSCNMYNSITLSSSAYHKWQVCIFFIAEQS